MQDFRKELLRYESLSLEDAEHVQLFRRMDSKYVFQVSELGAILKSLSEVYRVLEVSGMRFQLYQSTYYDTSDYKMYLDHHNERGNRFKVRERHYLSSGTSFFEVKHRHVSGITEKHRIALSTEALHSQSNDLIHQFTPYKADALQKSLVNSFYRIGLIHKSKPERVTIDFALHYQSGRQENRLDHLAVAELKQLHADQQSEFVRLMKKKHVRRTRFSKYCVGLAMLNPTLRKHRFLENIRFINYLKYAI